MRDIDLLLLDRAQLAGGIWLGWQQRQPQSSDQCSIVTTGVTDLSARGTSSRCTPQDEPCG
jgi:hypothetical protein